MHASKQTDQYDVSPAHRHRVGPGAGQGGGMMLSIQEDRVLYRWGCSQRGLLGSWTRCSRTRVFCSLRWNMAVCCISSALAVLWGSDQTVTQGGQRGWVR